MGLSSAQYFIYVRQTLNLLKNNERQNSREGFAKMRGTYEMNMPEWLKPASWGAVAGAIAAISVGFFWGGWVTSGTAGEMAATSAEAAVVQAFTPLCVAKAEQQPEQLVLLKKESTWKQDDFVVAAGWVTSVNEKYQSKVAGSCASAVLAALDAGPAEGTPTN